MSATLLLIFAVISADPLSPGTHRQTLEVDGRTRSFLVHVPSGFDAQQPAAVVFVLHGAGMNGPWMMWYTGMNAKSDAEGFIAVYPNGTGFGPFRTWNAGGITGPMAAGQPDDVAFLSGVIDHLAERAAIDEDRIYSTGLSNGGMMSYRLAAELADRIAAIGPIAGTMTRPDPQPSRPVPVIHFHGTNDRIVPTNGPSPGTPSFLAFLSVEETLRSWCVVNDCDLDRPVEVQLPDSANDGTTVVRTTYGPGPSGAEVVFVSIQNGGHTWPGRWSLLHLITGKSTQDISANDLLWEFFERHPRP